MHKQKDLDDYKVEFLKCLESIESGKTPVLNEIRGVKTMLVESLPYNLLSGLFLIIGTVLLSKFKINDTLKIALVLVVNSVCSAIANYIFTVVKHYLRLKLCNRLGIEATERNIAVMESLEY